MSEQGKIGMDLKTDTAIDYPSLSAADTSHPSQDRPSDAEDEDLEEKALVEAYQSKNFCSRYFLEFVLFLYTLGTSLYIFPLTNLVSEKLCLYTYRYNESLCTELQKAHNTIKDPILSDTQFYGFIIDAVMNVPGSFAALVSGNYLATYGFKAPLMITLIGSIVSCLCQLTTVIIMPAPVYFNLLAEIPGAITGGGVLMLTVTYSYVALRVPRSLQSERIMLVGVFVGVGLFLAALGGGALAKSIGMKLLTIICATFLVLPTGLVLVYIKDIQIPEENRTDSWYQALWHNIRDGFGTAFEVISQERPARRREQIVCLLMCFACAFFGLGSASGPLAFAYAESVLQFDQAIFGLWNGIGLGVIFVVVFPLIALTNRLKLSPPVIIAGGASFFMMKFAMLTFTEFFHILFYIQLFIGLPFYVSLVSMRAYMTDLLDLSEVPVVMAILAAFEKIFPVISGVLATIVYHHTNSSFPGCFFLILTVNYAILVGLGLYCGGLARKDENNKSNAES